MRLGIIEPDRLESPHPAKILTTTNSVPKQFHPKISGTAEEPGNRSRPPDRRGLGMSPSLYDGLVGRARAPVVPWPDLQIVAPSGKGPCSGTNSRSLDPDFGMVLPLHCMLVLDCRVGQRGTWRWSPTGVNRGMILLTGLSCSSHPGCKCFTGYSCCIRARLTDIISQIPVSSRDGDQSSN